MLKGYYEASKHIFRYTTKCVKASFFWRRKIFMTVLVKEKSLIRRHTSREKCLWESRNERTKGKAIGMTSLS